MFLAVSEKVCGSVETSVLRAANGFCGGVGSTQEELCGALAGGVLLIGLRHGRDSAHQSDHRSLKLVRIWRQAFLEHFGSTRCRHIYDAMHASDGPGTCAAVGEWAATALMSLLHQR